MANCDGLFISFTLIDHFFLTIHKNHIKYSCENGYRISCTPKIFEVKCTVS